MCSPFAIKPAYFLWLLLILLAGCKKKDASNGTPPDSKPPALITPVGTPVGNAVSKTIGTAGGSLVSPDGKLELTIPAGALNNNTNISIQPVTSEIQGEKGLSYDLLPNGTKFNKPATLTFHYSDDDVSDNGPLFLCIAYQDSSNKWITNLEQQRLDSAAKTLSLDINHFTIFRGMELGVKITAVPDVLHANETSTLQVWELLSEDRTVSVWDQLPNDKVDQWKVNFFEGGNNSDGKIEGSGSKVTYRAPADIPLKKPVRVAAHVKVNLTTYYNGHKINLPNGFDAATTITLEPDEREYNYKVTVTILDSTISGFYDQGRGLVVYSDQAKFDLNIKLTNGSVQAKVSNIKNDPPTVVPPTKSYHGIEFSWLADPYGEMNITGVTLQDFRAPSDSVLLFTVTHSNAYIYGFIMKNATDGSVYQTAQPTPFPGIPLTFEIDLKRTGAYLALTGAAGSYVGIGFVPQ